MLIYAVEDEPMLLHALSRAIRTASPESRVEEFLNTKEVLQEITYGAVPDVIFSDIEMPGMNGFSLAVQVKTLSPKTAFIFVTGFSEYAVDAYRIHAEGYIVKPVTPERVAEELSHLSLTEDAFSWEAPPLSTVPKGKRGLHVRCFGNFEVFYDEKPLLFERRQTKELFAFLIDREGAVCRAEEIASALWEDEDDMRAAKNRIRNLVLDLRRTLAGVGLEDLVIRRSGLLGLRKDLIDCDYFRMLSGDVRAVNAYFGEYMSQYTWASMTEGKLSFAARR